MSDFILDRSNYRIINVHQNSTITPYPFQEKAFAALSNLKRKNPDGFATMLVLPTGAGKTFTAVHWIIQNYVDNGVKVLWIAHRSELLRQAAETFYKFTTPETLKKRSQYESYVVSSEFGRSSRIEKSDVDVVIASRQSICSGTNMHYYTDWVKGKGLKADRKLLIVFDEAHHAAARSYRTIIKTMKKYVPHIDILGLTATPFRTEKHEQGSLKNIFNTGTGIAYSIDIDTLISAGILSDPIHIDARTNIDMTKFFDANDFKKIARNDLTSLDETKLEKLNKNVERNNLIVNTYLQKRKEFGQTIVFAIDVVNAIALNAIFKASGVKSDFVVSSVVKDFTFSTETDRNAKIINDFRNEKLEVLINVNIVTEGTDIPNINTVFLTRPTTSKILMTQMVGRGLRGTPSGGTKTTNLVYFIDDWKNMVDFVSPRELFGGEDVDPGDPKKQKKKLIQYIRISEIEEYALSTYNKAMFSPVNSVNIIPYGIIKCNYLTSENGEDETEYSKDILVYDESADVYNKILSDIPEIFKNIKETEENLNTKLISSELFFKYCENTKENYIGFSSERINDIILTYFANGEMPELQLVEDRVSLFDIAKKLFADSSDIKNLDETLKNIWNSNAKIQSWYDYDYFAGLINVYIKRLENKQLKDPIFVLPAKEDMDIAELKKYYPAYYEELLEYLLQTTKRDEEGYYYSAIQEEGKPPIRSKHRYHFEIDHIKPMSKGGKTEKGNLQLITRAQNRKKGASLD